MATKGVGLGVALATLTVTAAVLTSTAVSQGSQVPSALQVGTEPGAPWPTMRHDLRNTASSPLPAKTSSAQPWSFQTGRGIFATPVIDSDGVIYAGSADHNLYGLTSAGKKVWQFTTGGIIDTAPALLAPEQGVGSSLVVGSGDETLYRVRTGTGSAENPQVLWKFKPTLPPVKGAQLVSWWEGSPNVGPDGTIYQGNTGGAAYAINPNGTQKWAHQAANAVWTVPAMDGSGVTYWGSVDQTLFALNPDGSQKWKRTTLGYVTSSPALDTSGTIYAGSFDGTVYALNSGDGSVKWKFATGDHIYSSPALLEDADGALQQIIIGSTDGVLYSLTPGGQVKWAYDTGAPIRSSPVIGRTPDGKGSIVYVGSANGHLYAINTDDGSRRWAFDTTSTTPELATRHQLNSSLALGTEGVYLGSQDGTIWGVPYDFCLREPSFNRCVGQQAELPANGMFVFGVDAGGELVPPGRAVRISPAGYLTGRLVVRKDGQTVPARIVPAPDPARLVSTSPKIDAAVSVSGDGRYIFIRPKELLPAATTFKVTVSGISTTSGPRLGNVDLGTGDLQAFSGSFTVATSTDGVPWRPVVGPDAVTGVSLSRLAVPMPPMLTSVNQIGFDFYDWIGGVVRTQADSTVLWFVGAKRDAANQIVADPAALFAFPMFGRERGGTFSWNASQVNLWFTFGPVPLRRFDLRGTFGPGGKVESDAQFLAEAVCADIPGYGTKMPVTGMCDTQGVITAAGTYLGGTASSPAVRRVAGLQTGTVGLTRPSGGSDGSVTVPVTLSPGTSYRKQDHFVSVLLVDATTGVPVPVDYYSETAMSTDAAGNITGATVRIPANVSVPAKVEAIVMTDAFPAARQTFEGSGSS